LKVNTGAIFTGGTKITEHGEFNKDDAHVALLVSSTGWDAKVVICALSNQQLAPPSINSWATTRPSRRGFKGSESHHRHGGTKSEIERQFV
jgi:hypothetical protein